MEPTATASPAPATAPRAPFVPLFALGKTYMTIGAQSALEDAYGSKWKDRARDLIDRHVCGDDGETCAHDKAVNRKAIKSGARIVSLYHLIDDTRLFIITDGDDDNGVRHATTLLLPEEY